MGKKGMQSISRAVFAAVSGRLGVVAMTLSYVGFAVILLAYVSTQVYTSSLQEEISQRKLEERSLREDIGMLMVTYTGLVSKPRIANYCEAKLGMVEANPGSMTRVSTGNDDELSGRLIQFTEASIQIPDVLGTSIGELSEAIRR
jgi:hypothetical protein